MAKRDPVYSRQDEYETQLYGFCQKDLMEHIKASMFEEYTKTVRNVKISLLESETTDECKSAIERVANNMLEKWPEVTKAPFERLEEQLHGFMDLPPHILLNEDKLQRNRHTPEDELNEKSEIDKLKSRYRRAMYLKKCYEEELEMAKQMESRVELFQTALDQLENPQVLAKAVKSKEMHSVAQNLLGAEVEEANLKLSTQLPCEESNPELMDRVLELYDS
ncbi:protein MIS12 homolog [Thrips palmi]|uniref:Protein MIS12 homolog n=1 Tax=Thrips palmi TaxID=161013 RepID=A0A6P9A3D3_THRPL|nr:protein MIS12 homolog [Thrips palmi]